MDEIERAEAEKEQREDRNDERMRMACDSTVAASRLMARATVYAALVALPRTVQQGRDPKSIARDAVAAVALLEAAP